MPLAGIYCSQHASIKVPKLNPSLFVPTGKMAPSAIEPEQASLSSREHRKHPKSSGSLDQFEQIDVTPIIGTEFPTAQLTDWINAPNADDLLRDLAIKSMHISNVHLHSLLISLL